MAPYFSTVRPIGAQRFQQKDRMHDASKNKHKRLGLAFRHIVTIYFVVWVPCNGPADSDTDVTQGAQKCFQHSNKKRGATLRQDLGRRLAFEASQFSRTKIISLFSKLGAKPVDGVPDKGLHLFVMLMRSQRRAILLIGVL